MSAISTKYITTTQLKTLRNIARFILDHQYSPTHSELAALNGNRGQNAASAQIKLLKRKGFVVSLQSSYRSLTVTQKGFELLQLLNDDHSTFSQKDYERLMRLSSLCKQGPSMSEVELSDPSTNPPKVISNTETLDAETKHVIESYFALSMSQRRLVNSILSKQKR